MSTLGIAELSTFAHLMGSEVTAGENPAPVAPTPNEPAKPVETPATPPPAVPQPSAQSNGSNDERARCAAIFASDSAAKRPDVAQHLAFKTSMSAEDAVAMLDLAAKDMPAAAGNLSTRMAAIKNPNVGSEGGNSELTQSQRILAAHAKATGTGA